MRNEGLCTNAMSPTVIASVLVENSGFILNLIYLKSNKHFRRYKQLAIKPDPTTNCKTTNPNISQIIFLTNQIVPDTKSTKTNKQ